jgi:AraC-like DNA-binding protein
MKVKLQFMTIRLPFEISNSKKQVATWDRVLPKSLMKYRIWNSTLYYAGLGRSGHVISQRLHQKSFSVWLNHYLFEGNTGFNIKSVENCLILYYMLDGSLQYRNGCQHNKTEAGHFNMISGNAFNYELIPDGECSVFMLFLPAEMLISYRQTFPIVDNLLATLSGAKKETFLEYDIADDGPLRYFVTRMLPASNRGPEYENFYPATVDGIIMTVLDQLTNAVLASDDISGLRKEDISVVKSIRACLLDKILELRAPKVQLLSRMVGLGEKKLESAFKRVYKITMFDFFQVARMEAIYRALSDMEKTLAEIATKFHYEDYSSFSAAVKKKFGKSPREVRKTLTCLGPVPVPEMGALTFWSPKIDHSEK